MPSRTPVFAANWKMNTTVAEGADLCRDLRDRLREASGAEIVICPPFTHLVSVRDRLDGSVLRLGAQNMFWERKGAFTGEVSPVMLAELVSHVIIGHSERRRYFGECDADVNRKLAAALDAGLVPILCVGETGEERAAGQTEDVLSRQIRGAAVGLSLPAEVIVAYEPVWAIGTGVAADAPQAQIAIAFIRSQLRGLVGDVADSTRVLYGGSVTPTNVEEFMTQSDIDGALVGGASLSADGFAQIVRGGAAAAATRTSL